MKNSDNLSIHSMRKKILIISKVIGAILVISYIFSTKLPFSSDISFFIWTVFMVLLIFAVDFLMSCFISKPIAELEQAAKRMADLDFSSPCDIMTNDEFGRLSTSLNVMAENLQNAFIKLEAANKQLEKDVEQERILLTERKDLVDSLSHEMKTPLGVIRAYAEGYQDEDDEMKKQKYAEIIISETERMNHLITTLLDLSALETGAVQLAAERFDFVELLETVAGRLLIDTPDVNFELQYELPDYKVYVYTDKIRMEQVLNNLIINAKRNVKAKGVLKLCLSDENGLLHFSVYNQGDTIPNEKLKKIWTKFYRDNRSRYSGSGLGLAIVAQILSMQKLSYGAKNLADGVQFYFSIPTVK
ncbi:MAG: HAMP domain-containing histidine kinase [Lachnospiraceae bacterium]|nr:HAMP domain-containing histidine kinase [Lachnospiraceae bacterium]